MKSAQHPLVPTEVSILLQGKKVFNNLFFKIKICTPFFLNFLLPPYCEIKSDPKSVPDPKFPENSDPDPKKIFSDPQHWLR